MKKELFDKLTKSLEEMVEIRAGKRKPARVTRLKSGAAKAFPPARIKALRKRTKLSQADFAALLHIPKSTLQNWEQGRNTPEGAAQALLQVAELRPEAVLEALHA